MESSVGFTCKCTVSIDWNSVIRVDFVWNTYIVYSIDALNHTLASVDGG